MNHLAHFVLAGPSEPLRLGAILGDHVKGVAAVDRLPARVAAGIRLHRLIDAHTDAHPAVCGLLEDLSPPWRRYGGVILDVLFDHMLTRHWNRFVDSGLEAFAREIDDLLTRHYTMLPPRLALFANWARNTGLWSRFGEVEMLNDIFTRLAKRHGRPSPLSRGVELLEEHDAAIESAFLKLFPDMETHARQFRIRVGL